MAGQLELEICGVLTPEQSVCPLCSAVFEPLQTAGIFYDGPAPMGYVCERCLMTGPRAAAAKVGERAAALRSLVEQATENLASGQWFAITEAIRERADRYDSLAERLRLLPWWVLRREEESA